jgi:hypothetical protein
MSLVAFNGCTPVWSQGHPYTESTPAGLNDRYESEVKPEDRAAMRQYWDDELARQSARRLDTYRW